MKLGTFKIDGSGPGVAAPIAMVFALAVAFLLLAAGSTPTRAEAPDVVSPRTIVQPPPLKKGPGGINYKHKDWRVSEGGEGIDAWITFEPAKPRPKRAPLAIVTHGYFEFEGYDRLYELIRHTVLRGSVVVFPRYQIHEIYPCIGAVKIDLCVDSAVNGIRGGLSFLQEGKNRVKPALGKTSYYGFSFGAILTANLANRYKDLELPKPRAIFLDDPHDGATAGPGEPGLDDSLAGIPAGTKFECHSGAQGVIAAPGLEDGSCNAVFPLISHIPKRNKSLVLTQTDDWGVPGLSSVHGVCAGGKGTADAYDWRFCWKVWDALRSCAYRGKHCETALGKSRKHTGIGRWSDGTSVTPLKVRKAAPIRP